MTNTIDATEVDVVQEQIDNLRDKRREVDALILNWRIHIESRS